MSNVTLKRINTLTQTYIQVSTNIVILNGCCHLPPQIRLRRKTIRVYHCKSQYKYSGYNFKLGQIFYVCVFMIKKVPNENVVSSIINNDKS